MINENSSVLNSADIENNFQLHPHASGALQSKNIRIHKHRTSIRLESEMWNALNEIAAMEGCSIHDLCGAVHDLKEPGASFTAALRVFMMEYYRSASRVSSQVSRIQKKVKANQTGGGGYTPLTGSKSA